MTDHLADRCTILEAENDELRERIIQLEKVLTAGYDRMPVGGLTSTEAVILAAIAAAEAGATKSRIFDAVYAMRRGDETPEMKIVDVFVCKLRRKLWPYDIEIETVWGWGYRMSQASREKLAELRSAIS